MKIIYNTNIEMSNIGQSDKIFANQLKKKIEKETNYDKNKYMKKNNN